MQSEARYKKNQVVIDKVDNNFVIIVDVKFVDVRKWVYCVCYITNKYPLLTGGSSFWHDEYSLSDPSTTEEKLIARVIQTQHDYNLSYNSYVEAEKMRTETLNIVKSIGLIKDSEKK